MGVIFPCVGIVVLEITPQMLGNIDSVEFNTFPPWKKDYCEDEDYGICRLLCEVKWCRPFLCKSEHSNNNRNNSNFDSNVLLLIHRGVVSSCTKLVVIVMIFQKEKGKF